MRSLFVLLALISGIATSQTTEKKDEDKKAVATNPRDANKNSSRAQSLVINVTGNTQSTENPCKATNCYKEPEPSWWHKLWFDPIATFTGALFLATAALIGTGIIQWRETRNTAKRQLRAYIAIDNPKGLVVISGYDPQVILTIKNVGQTPAYDLRIGIEMGIADFPIKPFMLSKSVSIQPHKIVLQPGANIEVDQLAGHKLTPEEVAEVVADKSRIYVRGKVMYRDTFKNPRFTDCFFTFGGHRCMKSGQMEAHSEGNDAN